MNKVDLNIDNYSYENILELFHLDYNFDMNELKNAKYYTTGNINCKIHRNNI